MRRQKIREILRREPFVPFDIKMSDGRVYEVDHPEFIMQSRDGSVVIFTTEDDRTVFLDSHHITTLEVANRPKRRVTRA